MMHWLELKLPPPLIAAVTALMIWVSHLLWPGGMLWQAPLPLTLTIAGLALGVGCLALYALLRHKTTIHPHTPHHTRVLVVSGIYACSRNPMYLALLFLLFAWALHIGHLLAPLWLAGFVAYMSRFQIQPEETVLMESFGEPYRLYCCCTRRWL